MALELILKRRGGGRAEFDKTVATSGGLCQIAVALLVEYELSDTPSDKTMICSNTDATLLVFRLANEVYQEDGFILK